MDSHVKKYLSKRFTSSVIIEQRRWKGIKLKLSFKQDDTFIRHISKTGFITILDDILIRKELGLIKSNRVYLDIAWYKAASNRPHAYRVALLNIRTATVRYPNDLTRESGYGSDKGAFGEEHDLHVDYDWERYNYDHDQFIMRIDFIKD